MPVMKMTRKADSRIVEEKEEITRNIMSAPVIQDLSALIIQDKVTRVDPIVPAAVSEATTGSLVIVTVVVPEEKVAVAEWISPVVDGPEVNRDKVDTDSRIRTGDRVVPRAVGTVDPRVMETVIWETRDTRTRVDMEIRTRVMETREASAVPSRIMDLTDMDHLVDMISPRDMETRVDGADPLTRVMVGRREIMDPPRVMETRVAGADLTRDRADIVAMKVDMADHRVDTVEARVDMATRADGADHQIRVMIIPADSVDQKAVMEVHRTPSTWDTMATRVAVLSTAEVMTREAVALMEMTAACSVSILRKTWAMSKQDLQDADVAVPEHQLPPASGLQVQALQTVPHGQRRKADVQNNISSYEQGKAFRLSLF